MNFPSKPEDCPDLCASTQDCTHYTWTDFNSGVCWMKENVVAKSDAIQKLDQNAICGVIDRPMVTSENDSPVEIIYAAGAKYRSFPQWISDDPELNSTDSNNLSENGRSTRYWDCCKVMRIGLVIYMMLNNNFVDVAIMFVEWKSVCNQSGEFMF